VLPAVTKTSLDDSATKKGCRAKGLGQGLQEQEEGIEQKKRGCQKRETEAGALVFTER
jgi:hypothetical protein